MTQVESKKEQILGALAALFNSIKGGELPTPAAPEAAGNPFWLSALALRPYAWGEHCLEAGQIDEDGLEGPQALYVIIPDNDDSEEEASFTVTKIAHVDLALCAPLAIATEEPFKQVGTIRQTLQNRLSQDAEAAMRANYTLGGLCENLNVVTADYSPETTGHESWAIVFLRLMITYSHNRVQP